MKGYSSRNSFIKSLAESGKAKISLSTLQRAEGSQTIETMSARHICDFLDENLEDFLLHNSQARSEARPDLAGEWTSYLIECDAVGNYGIIEGRCVLSDDGEKISGKINLVFGGEKMVDRILWAKRIRNVYVGETAIDGWTLPYNWGMFQWSIKRADNWLGGIATWFDQDTERVAWSPDIMIRKGCTDENVLIELAKKEIGEELANRCQKQGEA